MTIYRTIILWEKSFYFFYTQMKKSVFLLGLLTTTVCLTACGSKNFNMTFDEALEAANQSQLQEILAGNENFEQSFDIVGNYNSDWNIIDADISTSSKQNIDDTKSESSIKFSANINAQWEAIKVDWLLDLKLVDKVVYLNLWSLDLTWSENLAMIDVMLWWFKWQWLSTPMTGLSDMPSTFSYLKDGKALNAKVKEIINNEWSTVYNWKFKQFNGYNAWKFSLNNEKLNELIKEYYSSLAADLDEETDVEMPELNIQNFEWYLVITWKDKVTTVIESMDIIEDDITMNADWFAGDDYLINIAEWGEALITISAQKKSSKYDVSITISDSLLLNWTVSPKLSKSGIDLKFDAKLTVKAQNEWDADTIVPFKGSWNYKAISDFTVTAPENAQDLTELLWAYLGGAGIDVDEYADLEGIEDELNTEEIATEENGEEISEQPVENTEVVAEPTEEVAEAGEEVVENVEETVNAQ